MKKKEIKNTFDQMFEDWYENNIQKLEKKKPDFEVGKWYKDSSLLIHLHEEREEMFYGYGFNRLGEWMDLDSDNEFVLKGLTEATNKEVEEALIAEAKRRGFKKGVRFKTARSPHCAAEVTKFLLRNTPHNNGVSLYAKPFGSDDATYTVFEDGKWAEIIEDPKVTINGYEMTDFGDHVKFGCAIINKDRLRDLYTQWVMWNHNEENDRFNTHNRSIKSITLGSGIEITIDQLKQIVDNIK